MITAYGLLREAAAELDHLMRHSLKRSGLQMAMFELLLRLARSHGEKQRLTSLARELTVTTGGITRLVDRAENLGLVRREPCPDDARGSYAVLTEEGKRRLREALPDHLLEIDSLWMSQLADEQEPSSASSVAFATTPVAGPTAGPTSVRLPRPTGSESVIALPATNGCGVWLVPGAAPSDR